MNYAYFKHELSLMIRSKKNMMFVLFLFALMIAYCVAILPNKQTIDSFDSEQMKLTLIEMEGMQESREAQGATGIIDMVGISVYALDQQKYMNKAALLQAFEKSQYTRFLRLKYVDMDYETIRNDKSLFPNSPFPGKDRDHLFRQTMLRYESYLTKDLPISYEIIEQKTAIQTLQNLLVTGLIYLLLFATIYLSSDVLVRDRKNRTVLQGMPIGWYRLINIKTLATCVYVGFVFTLLFVLGIGILTFQNGFGYMSLEVPITMEGDRFGLISYEMMTVGKFVLLALLGTILLIYLFIRLNMMLSLMLKNEWLVLFISTLILFSERLYFARDLREIMGIEISHFPQTYFEIGKVLLGEKNYLVNLSTITYMKGIVLLLLTIIVVEILLWLVSLLVNRQRFYRKNA